MTTSASSIAACSRLREVQANLGCLAEAMYFRLEDLPEFLAAPRGNNHHPLFYRSVCRHHKFQTPLR
ncbi:MAG: hypothetical protein N3A55_04175 [Methylohalobius sp.]|nr:hypothetical protein [Methylohalobius sp.]